MKSAEAAAFFRNRSVDMVFIDGGHRYEDVWGDIEAWLPKTRKLLCGHDYNHKHWPGVVQAVEEKFPGRFELVKQGCSIWYVRL
jgi:hypothetical protein